MLDKQSYIITIKGLVQGVGFRPFIYRIAQRYGITGNVVNNNEGVIINIDCEQHLLDFFVKKIKDEAPLASDIFSIDIQVTSLRNYDSFTIAASTDGSESITEVAPDIAVCNDCLRDISHQEHRISYPLINCTNCGPRFSIIEELPYDRHHTSMKNFPLCPTCKKEYEDIFDRRFHAQPVSCNHCGPVYYLPGQEEETIPAEELCAQLTAMLEKGKIIALKGTGGYNLVCDALNEAAVTKLRTIKNRESKPFAVMFSDMKTLKEYAHVSPSEEECLESWKRPIVLLKQKKNLAYSVTNGFKSIGAILPYMPFHYMLFKKLTISALVLTSGNICDEPIIIDDKKAHEVFSPLIDGVVAGYNRDIINRTDDSVSQVINDSQRVIRRSRGWVPNPIRLSYPSEGILACGAELVNTFAIGKEKQAILSQHIGDLKNLETFEFYKESYERVKKLFRFTPELIAHDMHPDYISTRFAQTFSCPKTAIQHHHAHIASCMAEHGLDEPVIGVCFDGTGLGDDNNIWGGEFFICDLDKYQRINHLPYLHLPGGDLAVKKPWRTSLGILYSIYGQDLFNLDIDFIKKMNHQEATLILQAIDKKINTPLSSGAGRLFDAVAAILTICMESGFHAEAPMRLEAVMESTHEEIYNADIADNHFINQLFKSIIGDIQQKKTTSYIATKFHNTIISLIFTEVKKIRSISSINKVVLSGGVFQNKYLCGKTELLLEQNGFLPYSNRETPCNDGGISLGQLAIAAKKRIKT